MSASLIWFYLMFLPFILAGLWLCAEVARKAGFSRGWCLPMLVPGLNILLIWVFAFVQWPSIDSPKNAEESVVRR